MVALVMTFYNNNKPKSDTKEITCARCTNAFVAVRQKGNRIRTKYCLDCRFFRSGDKTKGDLFKSRKNWQSARGSIQRHARRTYIRSGKEMECLACRYNKHVEIAHIKSVSQFSDEAFISEINSINNLIPLCPNHHWEYDNGVLLLPEWSNGSSSGS